MLTIAANVIAELVPGFNSRASARETFSRAYVREVSTYVADGRRLLPVPKRTFRFAALAAQDAAPQPFLQAVTFGPDGIVAFGPEAAAFVQAFEVVHTGKFDTFRRKAGRTLRRIA